VRKIGIAVIHRRDDRERRQRPERQERLEDARRRAYDAQRTLEPLSQEDGHGADWIRAISGTRGGKTYYSLPVGPAHPTRQALILLLSVSAAGEHLVGCKHGPRS